MSRRMVRFLQNCRFLNKAKQSKSRRIEKCKSVQRVEMPKKVHEIHKKGNI